MLLLATTPSGTLSSGHWLAILLWVGAGALTIALLLLMRTHFGQARPISKCVALSVFAHILLATYAYSTRLIIETPGNWQSSAPVRIAFVESETSLDEAESVPPADIERWDAVQPDVPESAAVLPEPVPPPEITVDLPPVADVPPMLIEESVAALLPETPTTEASSPPAAAEDVPADEPVAAADVPVVSDADQPPMPESPVADHSMSQGAENTVPPAGSSADDASAAPQVATTPQGAIDTPPVEALPPAVPRRAGDVSAMPETYRGRLSQERTQRLLLNGGNEQTEAAIEAALAWLAAHQSADGRWNAAAHGAGHENKVLGHDRQGAGADADTGITGLALLTFLGAGHTHFEGAYRKQVQHGLEFLVSKQAADGSLAGGARIFSAMYCHGIAFLALSEAYAMTGDQRLRPYVERAQRFTLLSQIPHDGGWRYQRGDVQGDMSQFGWQVMALRSAELGGIPIPAEARRRMLSFVEGASSGRYGGLASYRAGTRPSRTMTAEALACRFFLQAPLPHGLTEEASQFLLEEPPGGQLVNLYYWYYGTLALHQVQGERWAVWNARLQQQLLARQEQHGDAAGSWAPDTMWGGYGGRVYSTAMAALCLEVYYRYLPMHAGSQDAAAPLEEAGRFVPRLRR